MVCDKICIKCKECKNIVIGVVYVNLLFNNIKILILDVQGNVILWLLVGMMGFKGLWKLIFYVVQMVVEDVGKKVQEYGVCMLEVEV